MKKKSFKIPGIWIAIVVLYMVSVIVNPNMLSGSQIMNLMKVVPFLGVVALGHTFVVFSGGTDLSVAGLITATIVVACRIMDYGKGSILMAVLVTALLGIAVGVINGLLVTKLKMLPLVVTLAINYVIFGLTLILSGGVTIGRVSPEFEVITKGYVFNVIPMSFIILLAVTLLLWIVLNKTKFGQELKATGSNTRAAYVSGINTDMTKIKAHIVCSLSAVGTGLLLSSYIQIPSFDAGDPYSLNSLAAVVVGGTLMTGGVGSVVGSLGGAIFVTILNSFLNVVRTSLGVQYIIQGSIIIIGIWASSSGLGRKLFASFKKVGTAQ
jgi:ribose transport system permease protein